MSYNITATSSLSTTAPTLEGTKNILAFLPGQGYKCILKIWTEVSPPHTPLVARETEEPGYIQTAFEVTRTSHKTTSTWTQLYPLDCSTTTYTWWPLGGGVRIQPHWWKSLDQKKLSSAIHL